MEHFTQVEIQYYRATREVLNHDINELIYSDNYNDQIGYSCLGSIFSFFLINKSSEKSDIQKGIWLSMNSKQRALVHLSEWLITSS